jgi:hypothetical protein
VQEEQSAQYRSAQERRSYLCRKNSEVQYSSAQDREAGLRSKDKTVHFANCAVQCSTLQVMEDRVLSWAVMS